MFKRKSNLIFNFNKNKDNIFICNTPYHLIISLGYIINFHLETKSIIIVINDGKFIENLNLKKMRNLFNIIILRGNNKILNKNRFKKVKIYKNINKYNYELIKQFKNKSFNIVYFLDLPKHNQFILRFFKRKTYSKFFLLEEGVGIYSSTLNQNKKKLIDLFLDIIFKMKKLKYIGELKLNQSLYVSEVSLINKKGIDHIYNENSFYFVEKNKDKIKSLFKKSLFNFDISKKGVVFFSQPYDELRGVSKSTFLNLLETLEKYCKNYSYHLYIKPHPRENRMIFKNINCTLLSNIPAELITFDKKSLGVTISSSSLLNVKINKKIYLFPLFDEIKIDKVTKKFLKKKNVIFLSSLISL
jgi:hypothetical protein